MSIKLSNRSGRIEGKNLRDKFICNTSKGVKGQLPFNLLAPGFMIRPGLVNFPFQPFSLAASISTFSCSPPSYTQQEKATISYRRTCSIIHFEWAQILWNSPRPTSSNRRCTDTYLPPFFALCSFILSTRMLPRVDIGSEKVSAW